MDLLQKAETKATEEGNNATGMLALVHSVTINSQPGLEQASAHRNDVKDYWKRVDDLRKDLVVDLNKTVKKINDLFRPALDTAKEAEKAWNGKMAAFQTEQENKLKLQEAKAREAADKDRLKLEGQADKLAAKGKHDQAEAKREEAAATPTPVLAGPPSVAGTYFKDEWIYEVTELDKIPKEYWIVDHAALAKIVKATDGSLDIPGIRQYSKKIPVKK